MLWYSLEYINQINLEKAFKQAAFLSINQTDVFQT